MLVAGSLSSLTEGFSALVGEDGHLERLEGCLGYLGLGQEGGGADTEEE